MELQADLASARSCEVKTARLVFLLLCAIGAAAEGSKSSRARTAELLVLLEIGAVSHLRWRLTLPLFRGAICPQSTIVERRDPAPCVNGGWDMEINRNCVA